MIATLRGQVHSIRDNAVIIEVAGIGYLVHVVRSVLDMDLRRGQTVELYTFMHVRENEITLYGFGTADEKELFEVLLSVSGVGPRTALAALSAFSPEMLRSAVASGDAGLLSRIPGIGRKTAQRLLLDLKDRVGVPAGEVLGGEAVEVDADVVNALTALGYSLSEAQSAVSAIPAEATDLDERVLAALRHLGGG